jgi:hypothetical protein
MKFSYRQILASAAGAVISAVIASTFGVTGTIVGVAIGSIAATTGTALVVQSIDRTNKAVKQVAVRAPENSVLRRLGGTKAAGVTRSESDSESAVQDETATAASQATGSVDSESTAQMPAPTGPPVRLWNRRWPVIVLAIVGVFVFSLILVTVVELIAGRPLADLFGHSGGGTTVEKIFEPSTTTLPPPTTSTTTSTSSTTTTTSSSSSTTTTGAGSTTSTTDLGATNTTTSSVPGASTTTTPTTG